MSEATVELRGVEKVYGDEVLTYALRDIDLRLFGNELTALVGPSGSGKSTLLNILGLLDRPTRGTVRVLGEDTRHLDDEEITRLRGKTLGFVFQFHHLLPGFTAAENVAIPMAAAVGRMRPEMLAAALDLLAQVGLRDLGHRRPNQLSGGQQQRVAIARALAAQPSLVLADEPTGNLDRQTAQEVFELLQRIKKELGTSFLIVTHDHSLAERCDRMLEVVDGRLVSDRLLRDSPP